MSSPPLSLLHWQSYALCRAFFQHLPGVIETVHTFRDTTCTLFSADALLGLESTLR
jgi:hypothetical protein